MTSARSSSGGLYREYYEQHGEDRNDLLRNPEVLFQSFAIDRANIAALRAINLDKTSARILDVGCGVGAGLLQFIKLGFNPANLSGIDLDAERIAQAQLQLPGIDIQVGDASQIPFADGTFDLVFESTMLATLDSHELLSAIARDMVRVTRNGGFIMLCDWRYAKRGSGVKTAISPAEIARLFSVGSATEVVTRARGALVPPLGRRLSKSAPSLYFLVQSLLPFAVGQVTTILRKKPSV
jgi:ubiquinone/menaquinone biosynthesis C-methylase UbiE